MEIVGIETEDGVHTIEMWHSVRQRCWLVERRDAEGNLLGQAVRVADEAGAAACVFEWLRAHPETHLVARAEPLAAAVSTRRAA